ncbi:MAG TPA: M28 family peptidase [Candidatus Acidoferrales bacterium]
MRKNFRKSWISGSLLAVISLAMLFTIASAKPAASQSKATKTGVGAYGNSDAINEEEMKIYDYFLASDQLEGRNLPSRGYDTAALYIASHLAEWKLKPMGSTTGTNGPLQPYFQPFELISRSIVAEDSKASVTGGGGGGGRGAGRGAGGGAGAGGGGGARGGAAGGGAAADLEFGKDWTAAAGGRGAPPVHAFDVNGSMVFAGNGYVMKGGADPYAGLDVKGKIVVVAGVPSELVAQLAAAAGGGRGAAPAAGAPAPLQACTDYLNPEQAAAKNGAVAVVTVANFQVLAAMANPNGGFGGRGGGGGGRGPAINGPAYQVTKFALPPACPTVPAITAGLTMTNAIFNGEKLSAQQVFYATGSNAKLDSFALTDAKKINIKLAVHEEENHAENVVGMLEGSDPVLKNEFVVISAHLDHIGLSQPLPDGHNVNNGADDDGSGSTGLLGIARAYAEGAAKGIRPKRSIIFLWNAGEEKGLWGSQYFNEFPFIDLTKVVADLNIDMIGRSQNPNSVDNDTSHRLVKHGDVMVVGPKVSSDDLEKTLETVNNNYQKLGLDDFYDTLNPDAKHDNIGPGITPDNPLGRGQGIFFRSDHYNFARMGIPIAFFTIGLHVDYHRPTDTPEKIDYKEIEIVSKTVSAVGWVLANQAGRPHVNATLPKRLMDDMETSKKNGWGQITPVMPPLKGEPF